MVDATCFSAGAVLDAAKPWCRARACWWAVFCCLDSHGADNPSFGYSPHSFASTGAILGATGGRFAGNEIPKEVAHHRIAF